MQSAETRLGADCGSDHELIVKIRLKLKKEGKTTRPFRYELNQIPYHYTVEVTNRFKGLDLIDKVPEELWMEVHDIVQEVVIKTIPKKKNLVTKQIFIVYIPGFIFMTTGFRFLSLICRISSRS